MTIPQEEEILLDIPSHDKIIHAGFSKSPALVEAKGSFVISPYYSIAEPTAGH
jgi:hypothetical protein